MSLKSEYDRPDPYERKFAVIGNFYSDQNDIRPKKLKGNVIYIEERDTPQLPIVNYDLFLNMVLDFVQRNNLHSVFESNDTIVITCDEKRFRELRREFESLNFSLFHASGPTYDAFLQANAEYFGRGIDTFNPHSPNFVSPVSKEGAQRAPVLEDVPAPQSFSYIN